MGSLTVLGIGLGMLCHATGRARASAPAPAFSPWRRCSAPA